MKVQTRFLLLIFGFLILIIVIYSAVIYYLVSEKSYEDFYKRLEIRAVTTAKINVDTDLKDKAALQELKRKYLQRLEGEKHYIIRVEHYTNYQSEATRLGVPVKFMDRIRTGGAAFYNRGNLYFSGVRYGNSIVVVSATNDSNAKQRNYLRGVIFASIVVLLLFVFLFSLLFSRAVFRPIGKLTKAVNAISTENLYMRLEDHKGDDELGELTRTFNTMLDRLETSFETQNNFISNASHELRTPLTSIIGIADVTLSKQRTEKEYTEALQVIAEEAEKLDRKTQALLSLAQTGFNGKNLSFQPQRIDELLMEAIATTRKLYPDCTIDLNLELLPENSEKLRVSGNEQLLTLALSNVIGNACKYSDNRQVRISIGASDKHIILIIQDQGIGIPEKELRYIYDPFFRASNTANFEGYGIGLPLTRNIIKLHKGVLLVTAVQNVGTTVKIKLPIHNP